MNDLLTNKYVTYCNKLTNDEQVMVSLVERPKNVQAFINNVSVPKTLEELEWFIDEYGCFHVEAIIEDEGQYTNWTVPRWTKIGDIVFFMHAKYGFSHLTALRTELNKNKNNYSNNRYDEIMSWINRGLFLNKKYGGKIFAIAQVSGMPTLNDIEYDDIFHWNSNIYADMDRIYVLENPIDISEFNEYIYVSRQSAITSVLGEDFRKLKSLIISKNNIPEYFSQVEATPIPLKRINKDNWMTISNEYRRSFMLETQFRVYYVDYLLSSIGDRKTIYKECRCRKQGIADSFVDNIIYINGKYLPVEVKLSIMVQHDIKKQVRKYCQNYEVFLDKKNRKIYPKEIYSNYCLVIDTNKIYLYQNTDNILVAIFDLDELKSKKDILIVRKNIISHIN